MFIGFSFSVDGHAVAQFESGGHDGDYVFETERRRALLPVATASRLERIREQLHGDRCRSEFDRKGIFDLIQSKRNEGWAFIYLGSEPESYAHAEAVAVAPANARHWDKTAHGTREMMDKMPRP
jgi:hypothetical protein